MGKRLDLGRTSPRTQRARWLSRSSTLAVAACCVLAPVTASAQVSVVILSGSVPPHATAGDLPDVRVSVSSAEEIVSVQADAGSPSVPLVYDQIVNQWRGPVPVSGARGPRTLTVTAVSASGAIGSASAPFFFSPPVPPSPPPSWGGLTVSSPQSGEIARPSIQVDATYVGSALVHVVYVPAPRQSWSALTDRFLLQGQGAIHGGVDLTEFDPSSGNLVFVASDGFGEIAQIWVPIEVRSAPDVVDGGMQSDAGPVDAGEGEGEDAGEARDDGGSGHGSHWGFPWKRHMMNCSASPRLTGTPLASPSLLGGSVVLLLIARRRRARRAQS